MLIELDSFLGKKLLATLEWYADDENYRQKYAGGRACGCGGDCNDLPIAVIEDEGYQARDLLKLLGATPPDER